MNSAFPVWEYLWVAMTWAFYLLAWAGALILVFACIVGLVRGVQSWRKPKPKPDWPRIERTAESKAILRYQDQPNADWRVDCYMAGVRDTIHTLKSK